LTQGSWQALILGMLATSTINLVQYFYPAGNISCR
jgi:hypothetical protein